MNRGPLLLASVAAAVYLLAVVSQFDKPLMYDDANFALAGRAVAQTGLPYGNQGWMSERGDFSQREQWALWHPPLYVYLIGAAAKLAGWTPPALRVLGLLGGLASGVLTYVLARDVTRGPPAARAIAAGLAAALFYLCPLVVQSTLALDIDLPLLMPLGLLFVWLYLRLEATARWPWLIPLFAILLWAKMTNPVPVVLVACTWQALRGNLGRAALHLSGIGIGGAALFGVSWLAVGRALGLPLDMPFGVNLVQWQDSAEVARRAYTSPGAFVQALQPTVIWLGPALVALGLAGCAVRVAQLGRCWRVLRADLLLGLLAALAIGYVNKYAGWFPKYEVALVPLLAALGAPLVAHAWCIRRDLTIFAAAAAALVAVAIDLFLVHDDWALDRTWVIRAQPALGLLAVLPGAMLLAFGAARVRGAAIAAIGALSGLALGWSLATDVYQARAPYSTYYWYGTTGVEQAAEWVNANLAPGDTGDTYVAAKEVAIRAADLRYVDQDNLSYFVSVGRPFDGTWAGDRVRAAVVWEREPYLVDVLARGLSGAGFHETARFGDYVIYQP